MMELRPLIANLREEASAAENTRALREALEAVKPGQEILIRPGNYEYGRVPWLVRLEGWRRLRRPLFHRTPAPAKP